MEYWGWTDLAYHAALRNAIKGNVTMGDAMTAQLGAPFNLHIRPRVYRLRLNG
jgi:hypothetical protein